MVAPKLSLLLRTFLLLRLAVVVLLEFFLYQIGIAKCVTADGSAGISILKCRLHSRWIHHQIF